jgi:hypothetical protein
MRSCALFQATQRVFSLTHRQMLVDEKTRSTLDKWLRPSVHVADSQCNAANARHPKTGLWLLERPEFREWIYAPGSFLWLHGMCEHQLFAC